MRPISILLVLLAMSVIGCGGSTPSAAGGAAIDPSNPCTGVVDDAPQGLAMDCAVALRLANERLGGAHWPISTIEIRDNLCPPGGRGCALMHGPDAWVIYDFWFGDPVMIHVGPEENSALLRLRFVAHDPEMPPDWLVEELRNSS